MTSKLQSEINNQIKEEIFSAYLYLSMSAYAKGKSLNGFANFFEIQYKEEMDHAMGLYNYLLESGSSVQLQAIAQPEHDFGDVSNLFTEALKHEKHITARINFLFELAQEEKDHAFASFLQWYLDEQVEEEATASEYVDKMALAEGNGGALLMLDADLMQRVYAPLVPGK